jgi:hypothetical protein
VRCTAEVAGIPSAVRSGLELQLYQNEPGDPVEQASLHFNRLILIWSSNSNSFPGLLGRKDSVK